MSRPITCKFCGSELKVTSNSRMSADVMRQYILCKGCHASFSFLLSMEKVQNPPVPELLELVKNKKSINKVEQLDLLANNA